MHCAELTAIMESHLKYFYCNIKENVTQQKTKYTIYQVPSVKSAFSFQDRNNFGLCGFPVFYAKMSQTFGKQPALDLCFLDKLHGLFLSEALDYLGASNVIQ